MKMQMTEEVLKALQVLKDNAENEFEKHRIAVLERDLTNPPQIEVVDETHQKFNGVKYRKTSTGHYAVNRCIHQAVYRYYYGEVPEGQQIHHIDWNPTNNDISNLISLTHAKHRQIHNSTPIIEKICPACGKTFLAKQTSKKNCCSIKCANKIKPHKEVTYIKKICPVCGKTFTVPYELRKQITCSKDCAYKKLSKPRSEKKCPVCGKAFTPSSKNPNKIYCSRACVCKMIGAKRRKS